VINRYCAAVTAATLGLTALAGCSSSKSTPTGTAPVGSAPASASSPSAASAPNAGLSGTALKAAFKKVVDQATAVHLKGADKEGTDTVQIDIQLNKTGNTAEGTITSQGASFPVIAVNGVDYFQFTDSLIKLSGAGSAGPALKGKWVSSNSQYGKGLDSSLRPLFSYSGFVSGFDSADTSAFALEGATAAGTTTYNGQTVAVYKGSDGSTAYFAASGPAYLLDVINSSSTSAGAVAFTWNQPTTVTAPPASQIFNG
jgi:hypothetical protein